MVLLYNERFIFLIDLDNREIGHSLCTRNTENLFIHLLGLNVKVLSAGNARSSQATEAYINNVHRFQQS